MSKTKIEWTDETWNPVVGCSVTSPGCTNCYAMRMAARLEAMASAKRAEDPDDDSYAVRGPALVSHYAGLTQSSKAGPVWTGKVALASDDTLTAPLRWKKPRRVFVNSMGDLFHESVPDEWIDRVFAVMALAPQHTFQVLTKRSARMRAYMTDPRTPGRIARVCIDMMIAKTVKPTDDWPVASIGDIDLPDDVTMRAWPLPNVWLGVSAEDQVRANERRDDLGALAAQGWTTFVSYEPALGPVDWTGWEFLKQLISGGESGPGARPSHPDWHRAARDFCAPRGIAYFFKQWGEWVPGEVYSETAGGSTRGGLSRHQNGEANKRVDGSNPPDFWWSGDAFGGVISTRVGKRRAGSLLDGVEHNAVPEVAR